MKKLIWSDFATMLDEEEEEKKKGEEEEEKKIGAKLSQLNGYKFLSRKRH
jgi:hypothetical protein